jgi:hypothetical protein
MVKSLDLSPLTDPAAAEHEQKTGSIESLKPVGLGREIEDGKSN